MNNSSLTDQQLADLLDAARADLAADVFADHAFGAPAHVETYRAYSIGVWQRGAGFYAELDNGDGDNGAAQGLYEDIESAVAECRRMIDHPYEYPADPAVLYFRRAGGSYRAKAFDSTVWIEAQPGGDNLPYERAAHPVFDGQTWDFDALAALVDIYRADGGDALQQVASGQQGRKSARPRSCRRRN